MGRRKNIDNEEVSDETVTEHGETQQDEGLLESRQRQCEEHLAKLEELKEEHALCRAAPSLTSEQRDALVHCIEWMKHFVSQSRNVEFRRKSKSAISKLGELLAEEK